MVAVVEHMGEDFVSEQAGRVGDMTDWLPTDELAARFGVNSYELLDALAKLGLAAGPRPTPLAEAHGFSSSGLNDFGHMQPLWHPDVCRLLQGVGLMLLPVMPRFGQSCLFGEAEEPEDPGLFEEPDMFVEPEFTAAGLDVPGMTTCDFAEPELSGALNAQAEWLDEEPLPGEMEAPEEVAGLEEVSGTVLQVKPVGTIRPGFERIIATDGACSGNPGPGGWAWVEQKSGARDSGGAARTTNNIMELTALIKGLEHVGPEPSLLIRCDSKYVIDAMTKWAPGWRRKGWKKADGQPVKNRELVERLLNLYEGRSGTTEVEWVKGHAGDTANELCDSLAVAQSKKFSR